MARTAMQRWKLRLDLPLRRRRTPGCTPVGVCCLPSDRCVIVTRKHRKRGFTGSSRKTSLVHVYVCMCMPGLSRNKGVRHSQVGIVPPAPLVSERRGAVMPPFARAGLPPPHRTCQALRCVALRCVALRCAVLCCHAVRCVALCYAVLPCGALRCGIRKKRSGG